MQFFIFEFNQTFKDIFKENPNILFFFESLRNLRTKFYTDLVFIFLVELIYEMEITNVY